MIDSDLSYRPTNREQNLTDTVLTLDLDHRSFDHKINAGLP